MGITLSLGACPAPPSWRKIKPEPKEPVLTEPLTATRTTDHDIQIGERILILLRAILVVLLTMVLGTVGILLCILRPGGSALIPVARLWSRLILKTYGVRFRPVYDPGLDAQTIANQIVVLPGGTLVNRHFKLPGATTRSCRSRTIEAYDRLWLGR